MARTIESIVHAKLISSEHVEQHEEKGFHDFRKRPFHTLEPSNVIFIFLNFQRESPKTFNMYAMHLACHALSLRKLNNSEGRFRVNTTT